MAAVLTSVEQVRAELQRGARYLDVRSREEFAAGHVPGAVNVPLRHGSLAGLVANPGFERELGLCLSTQQRWVVGCRSGQRARAASLVLSRLGFEHVVDGIGYEGKRDAFGRLLPGWSKLGLPIETGLSS